MTLVMVDRRSSQARPTHTAEHCVSMPNRLANGHYSNTLQSLCVVDRSGAGPCRSPGCQCWRRRLASPACAHHCIYTGRNSDVRTWENQGRRKLRRNGPHLAPLAVYVGGAG